MSPNGSCSLTTAVSVKTVFTETAVVSEHEPLGDMTIAYFRKHGNVSTPKSGRQTDLAVTN
jgi:hypothetical protein